jgi:hypothetical protein
MTFSRVRVKKGWAYTALAVGTFVFGVFFFVWGMFYGSRPVDAANAACVPEINAEFRYDNDSNDTTTDNGRWFSGNDISRKDKAAPGFVDINCFSYWGTAQLDGVIELYRDGTRIATYNQGGANNVFIGQTGTYTAVCRQKSNFNCANTDSFTVSRTRSVTTPTPTPTVAPGSCTESIDTQFRWDKNPNRLRDGDRPWISGFDLQNQVNSSNATIAYVDVNCFRRQYGTALSQPTQIQVTSPHGSYRFEGPALWNFQIVRQPGQQFNYTFTCIEKFKPACTDVDAFSLR